MELGEELSDSDMVSIIYEHEYVLHNFGEMHKEFLEEDLAAELDKEPEQAIQLMSEDDARRDAYLRLPQFDLAKLPRKAVTADLLTPMRRLGPMQTTTAGVGSLPSAAAGYNDVLDRALKKTGLSAEIDYV